MIFIKDRITPTDARGIYGEIIRPGKRPLPDNCVAGNCLDPIGYIPCSPVHIRAGLLSTMGKGRGRALLKAA